MVNTSFVAQAAPDIKRKLQKLEGFARMNITQPIEVANKVFMNREVATEREAEKRLKKKATLLAALKETDAAKTGRPQPPKGGKPRAPLAKDQCTCCKEKGHWKNECPNRKGPSKPSRYREEPRGKNLVGLAGIELD
ncbi:Hypothetical predicted protein [Lynx pardinus]|uniref:CCHC-type domain-containing protein n=1 Tax=Lynx pardinus TaxID=191816 RepID=A0A485PJ91_LYNPA|nr:Hypothetical predicted protein [Lynx pardinus]